MEVVSNRAYIRRIGLFLHACVMYGLLNISFALQHELDAQCVLLNALWMLANRVAECPLPNNRKDWDMAFVFAWPINALCVWWDPRNARWNWGSLVVVLSWTDTVALTGAHRHYTDQDATGRHVIASSWGPAETCRNVHARILHRLLYLSCMHTPLLLMQCRGDGFVL